MDYVLESIDRPILSPYGQMKLQSEINSSKLHIKNIIERLEYWMLKKLRNYNLMGNELRFHLNCLKVLLLLEMTSEQLFSSLSLIEKCTLVSQKFASLKQTSITNIVNSIRCLLNSFMNLFHSLTNSINIELNFKDIMVYEDKIDHIYKSHSKTLIDMAGAGFIDIDDAFNLTSTIRSLERVAHLISEMIDLLYSPK